MSADEQLLLFDAIAGEQACEEAIAQVDEHANPDWKQAAFEDGERVARKLPFFTTDPIWAELAEDSAWTHEPRAMGAVMRSLVGAGVCRKTERTVKTIRVAAHRRDLRIWQSLICPEA